MSTALIILLLINLPPLPDNKGGSYIDNPGASDLAHFVGPGALTYEEIAEIGRASSPPARLVPRLQALLTTPFMSNKSYNTDSPPRLQESDGLGRFLRVGQWNIERGQNANDIKLVFEGAEQFRQRIDARPDSARYSVILEQLDVLRSVDVLVLNEVDVGLKRTGYRDIPRELAEAMKMNYVYGVEFVEVDPLNLGADDRREYAAGEQAGLNQIQGIDRESYRGLHGTAILSRFPIKRARLIPLSYQPYDWYRQERRRPSIAEVARRQLSRVAFLEETERQIRFGGRSVLIVEIAVPQLPEGAITIVATHLENRCGPRERRRQMQEVLSIIKEIEGPVVLAGDLNTSGSNLRPTSIISELKKRAGNIGFWLKRGIKYAMPLGLAFDIVFEAISFARTAHDPTSKGLLLFAPNRELDLFKTIEGMRFSDGYAFDFRGDGLRTVNGTAGTLANSNQRAKTKGFITTQSMGRTFWAVGKSKLDWIFVKAFAKQPRGKREPYRLAPHFPRTLEVLNTALGHRLSDHVPITVDLPVDEPDASKFR
jgi:endonuclease/exonuclease/phosphatase family metal-dependent hydrolase